MFNFNTRETTIQGNYSSFEEVALFVTNGVELLKKKFSRTKSTGLTLTSSF